VRENNQRRNQEPHEIEVRASLSEELLRLRHAFSCTALAAAERSYSWRNRRRKEVRADSDFRHRHAK
jgi:hypothetical protein